MKLTLWTYEGPPHIGAMRVATAMKDVHYVLHAPQGDTYADCDGGDGNASGRAVRNPYDTG